MAFALKFQLTDGKTGQDAAIDADFRGGEPNDFHRTVFEVDPVQDDLLDELLVVAPKLNAQIREKTPDAPLWMELRIMDSNP